MIAADDQGNVFRFSTAFNVTSTPKEENESILDLDISANDNYVITGGKSKFLRVWSITESDMEYSYDLGGWFRIHGLVIELNQPITSVTSSAVSSLLLSGSEDANVHLWDLRKKSSIRRM